jgi:hypothetical protein
MSLRERCSDPLQAGGPLLYTSAVAQCVRRFVSSEPILSLSVSGDGGTMVAGTANGLVIEWNTASEQAPLRAPYLAAEPEPA